MTPNPTEEQTGALGSEQERVAKIIRETVIGAYTGDCAGMDEVTLYRVEKAAAEILAALSPEARPVLEREAVARIIEPRAFERGEQGWQWRYRDALTVQAAALAKADAIIALQSTRGGEGE